MKLTLHCFATLLVCISCLVDCNPVLAQGGVRLCRESVELDPQEWPCHPLGGGSCHLNTSRNWHVGNAELGLPASVKIVDANSHGLLVGNEQTSSGNYQPFTVTGNFGPDGQFYASDGTGILSQEGTSQNFLETYCEGANCAENALVTALNDSGLIVGFGRRPNGSFIALTWSGSDASVTALEPLAQATSSSAQAVNDGGLVLGVFGSQLVVWNGPGDRTVLSLPATGNYSISTSNLSINDGTPQSPILVSASLSSDSTGLYRPFIWERAPNGSFSLPTQLPLPNVLIDSSSVYVTDVNDVGHGQAVGYATIGGGKFLPLAWERQVDASWTLVSLSTNQTGKQGENIQALAANEYGQIVGVRYDFKAPSKAVVFQNGLGWTDLQNALDPEKLSGLTVVSAFKISNSGRILALGRSLKRTTSLGKRGETMVNLVIEPTYYRFIDLSRGSQYPTYGVGLSENGVVVTQSEDSDGKYGTIWHTTDSDVIFSGYLSGLAGSESGGWESFPMGVTTDGSVFGKRRLGSNQETEGVVWDASQQGNIQAQLVDCTDSIVAANSSLRIDESNYLINNGGRGACPRAPVPAALQTGSLTLAGTPDISENNIVVGSSSGTTSSRGLLWRTLGSSAEILPLPTTLSQTIWGWQTDAVSEQAEFIAGHAVDAGGNSRALLWALPQSSSSYAGLDLGTLWGIDQTGHESWSAEAHLVDVSADGFAVGTATSPVGQIKSRSDTPDQTVGIFAGPSDWNRPNKLQSFSKLLRSDKFVVTSLVQINSDGLILGNGKKIVNGQITGPATAFVAVPPTRNSWACQQAN